MLKHQKQGYNECLITSIAIIMDVDREQLLDIVKEGIDSRPWYSLGAKERTQAINLIRSRYPDRFPKWLNVQTSIRSDEINSLDPEYVMFNVSRYRGVMMIASPQLGGHIVAFEHGRIFDSAQECPMDAKDWLRESYSYGFNVHSVVFDPASVKLTEGMNHV